MRKERELKDLMNDLNKSIEKEFTYYQESNFWTLKCNGLSVFTVKGMTAFIDALYKIVAFTQVLVQSENEIKKINYKDIAKGFYNTCLDIARDDNQNFGLTYLDCQTNDEYILNNIDFDLLVNEIKTLKGVTSCENTHDDAIEIFYDKKTLKGGKN